jgi:hypothetical protein
MHHYYPTVPYPFTMPFYYSSLTNIAVYYLVPVENVSSFLKGTGLKPALFNGQAMVTYNFQLYTGQFSSGMNTPIESWASSGAAVTQELELNIVVYPETLATKVLPLSAVQFIQDGDQSKILGNHRVRVPCDADIAIQAGVELFGEPKFKTSFKVNLPSPNPVRQDSVPYIPEWEQTWGFQINDPTKANEFIFNVIANLDGLNPIPGNISPITEYGTHDGKMISCRWNIQQAFNTYFLSTNDAGRVALTYGNSSHPMREETMVLIGNATPFAVQTLNSAPAAIQSRAFYP